MSPITPADRQTLTPGELVDEHLDDWRYLAGKLRARFQTRTFDIGMSLLGQIAAEADSADHHPDVDLRYSHLDITLRSHDVGGITRRDVRLARLVSQFADGLRATPLTAELQVVTLALDTTDSDEIRPFWQAVLGLEPEAGFDDFLFDSDGHTPGLFLQQTDAHEPPKQRFHIDIDVPADVASARIGAALDAGGTLVSDAHSPAWWTLADAQGNKVDIATWQGRD